MAVSLETYMSPKRHLVNRKRDVYDPKRSGVSPMGLAKSEEELRDRASRFIKAELKRAKMTYADLAVRLKEHGLTEESETTVKAKLKRGTFAATWLLATLAALGRDGVKLEEL
jgi:Domain of unknown function (DUF6471)